MSRGRVLSGFRRSFNWFQGLGLGDWRFFGLGCGGFGMSGLLSELETSSELMSELWF